MHIAMIYGEPRPFPPDIRVQKEVKTLYQTGHRITILCCKLPAALTDNEIHIADGFSIRREKVSPMKPPEYIDWYLRLRQRPWIPVLYKFIRRQAPDVLHVHDLIILPTVLAVARQFDIPVIADLHENMPAAKRAYRSDLPFHLRLLKGTLYNYYHWRRHEARSLHRCLRVVVVVPEAAERLREYGVPSDRIVVVSNTEDEESFPTRPQDLDPQILEKYRPDWTALYIGGIDAHRGIDTAIKATVEIGAAIENYRLLVVGANAKAAARLQALAKRHRVEGKVEIVGWVPFRKVASYIHASKICLVPHKDFEHTNTTVPHKLFQYMISEKPVLVSTCRPLARIVNETGAGVVFEAGNPRDMAQKLILMAQNDMGCKIMGRRGRQSALGKYSWKNDAQRLVDLYANLSGSLRN